MINALNVCCAVPDLLTYEFELAEYCLTMFVQLLIEFPIAAAFHGFADGGLEFNHNVLVVGADLVSEPLPKLPERVDVLGFSLALPPHAPTEYLTIHSHFAYRPLGLLCAGCGF